MIAVEDITNEMLHHLLFARLLYFNDKVDEVVRLINLRLPSYTDKDKKDFNNMLLFVRHNNVQLTEDSIKKINKLLIKIKDK